MAAAALCGVFVVGSLWSVQAYEKVTSGLATATYIANARQALNLAPRGTAIVSSLAPPGMVNWGLGRYQFTSALIGDLARGKLARQVRWVSHPVGTIDGLMIFGSDGRLYPAQLSGVTSAQRSAKQGCWPERHGKIVVRSGTHVGLRLGVAHRLYLVSGGPWIPHGAIREVGSAAGRHPRSALRLSAHYRQRQQHLVGGLSRTQMCVGDVEAGALGQ